MSVFLFALVKRYNHNCSTVSEIWFTRENWIGYVICDAGIMLLWMISDWDHCAVFIMPALWLQEEKKKKQVPEYEQEKQRIGKEQAEQIKNE